MLLRLSLILISFLLCIDNAFANVTAVLEPGRIMIRNQTPQTICFEVHEEYKLTLIEWAPICGEDNRILANQLRTIHFTREQFEPSGVAVVSWWQEENNSVSGQLRLKTSQRKTRGPGLPLK